MCFCQNGKIVLLQIAQSVVFKTTGPHRTAFNHSKTNSYSESFGKFILL